MRSPATIEPCELSESKAIRLAQRGDAGAFERLYRLHSARVYALCVRMLRDSDAAEDSTQEVFLTVFRKIHGFRGDSAFSTWLHRVAMNTVLMRLRLKRPVKVPLESAEADQTPGMTRAELGAADPRLEGYVNRVTLEKAIAQLPPRCKLMFVLYDIHGYAHREIAKIAGCSIGNAKCQLHKARVRLRQLLLQDKNGASETCSLSGRTDPQRCAGLLAPRETCEST